MAANGLTRCTWARDMFNTKFKTMRTLTIIIDAFFEQVDANIKGVEAFLRLPKADKTRIIIGYTLLTIATVMIISIDLMKAYFKI